MMCFRTILHQSTRRGRDPNPTPTHTSLTICSYAITPPTPASLTLSDPPFPSHTFRSTLAPCRRNPLSRRTPRPCLLPVRHNTTAVPHQRHSRVHTTTLDWHLQVWIAFHRRSRLIRTRIRSDPGCISGRSWDCRIDWTDCLCERPGALGHQRRARGMRNYADRIAGCIDYTGHSLTEVVARTIDLRGKDGLFCSLDLDPTPIVCCHRVHLHWRLVGFAIRT